MQAASEHDSSRLSHPKANASRKRSIVQDSEGEGTGDGEHDSSGLSI
jgi:hypothetical protein